MRRNEKLLCTAGVKMAVMQVATFTSELGEYSEAIQIFEEIATRYVDIHLDCSAKAHLLNAGICHLCGEPAIGSCRAYRQTLYFLHAEETLQCAAWTVPAVYMQCLAPQTPF